MSLRGVYQYLAGSHPRLQVKKGGRMCVCGHDWEDHLDRPEARFCFPCSRKRGTGKCTYFRRQSRIRAWWKRVRHE